MAELGAGARAYHDQIGRAAAEAGVDVLVAVGPLARSYLDAAQRVPERLWAPDAERAIPLLRPLLRPGDCVLVKGSRSVGLEAVADAISPVRAA
jgi:UDP-N-acetylmuramoyl-tripeptide--D-alanyl-D-alanine ligase